MALLDEFVLALQNSLVGLVSAVIGFGFAFVAAAVLLVIGIVLGMVLKKIVSKILNTLALDKWVEEHGLHEAIGKTKLSDFVGELARWYTILLFFGQSLSLLKLDVLGGLASVLVSYLPLLSISVIIVVIGLFAAKYVGNKIDSTGFKYKKLGRVVAEITIVYVAVVMGLENTGLKVTLLSSIFQIAFSAFVLVVAIIFAVLFILAYKEDLFKLVKEFKKR
ncbi:MAG: hypothetical protein Q7K42_02815 [Candidatus Diapherotrites archaeon]|nr:hypothetical protein [Candidatus Diapherotrites archaeon]